MRKIFLIILSILILNTLGFSENNDPEAFQAKYYDNAKLLRVKFVEGEAYVQRSYDDALEEATINLPIFEKDSVGTTEGRLEIYLGRLNYLRLDFDSELEFNRVPELRKTNAAIRLSKGGIYLDVENLDFERDIEIQTPDCGVFLLDKGVYRVNVNEAGATEVYVYEGIAEVSGKDYSRNVRESQKIVMLDGQVRERPFYFYASDTDGFDRWNQKRNSDVGYARYSTSRYLDSGYEDYEYELSRNGRWVYNTTYREYIWIPYNIGADWSPYYHGRWVWSPFYGYVWSSYDPWGYFTHHYGRWHWDSYYGWHWYAGYHWSPGWVYWSWNDHHYGWCPLSRWNRPIIILNKRWMRNYNYRNGIPVHSRATVIIKKHHLNSSHIGKVALKRGLLKKGTIRAKGFAPKMKPSIDKIKVVNARGKTVAYKKSGLRIGKKYQAVKTGSSGVEKKAVYKYTKSKDSSSRNAFKYSKHIKTGKPGISTTKYKSSEVKSRYKSSTTKSPTKYRSKTSASKTKYRSKSSSKSPKKSSTRSTRSKSSSKSSTRSRSSRSSSSGKSTKVKKKDSSPSYSSYPSRSNSYSRDSSGSSYKSSYGTSNKSSINKNRSSRYYNYSSPSYKSRSGSSSSSSSYKSYKPSTRYKSSGSSSPSRSRSYSSSSSYKSYSRPSYKSSGSSRKSYSRSRGSSRSYSGRSGGSSRSYSGSSSRSSSSRSSSSHSSSSRSSSSRSSSSRSSSVKSSSKK